MKGSQRVLASCHGSGIGKSCLEMVKAGIICLNMGFKTLCGSAPAQISPCVLAGGVLVVRGTQEEGCLYTGAYGEGTRHH